jgi:3'-phosphoadenosine 5'-phosphosulfate sulfotransferase (PAPS reductase)/FAD synthetase
MARKSKSKEPYSDLGLAFESVPIGSVQPHPKNARQGDIGAICESIKANGFYRPLVVQRSTTYILAGNHAWRAAAMLGMERVPVAYIDCDDETALRILLVDNRTNDLASYDDAALAELLQSLPSLEGTGYDAEALDELLADLGIGAEEAEPEAPTFQPESIKGGSVAELAPSDEERAILAKRKLLVEYSGGKDSGATAIWARHYFPKNSTELLFVDMGADFVGFHLYLHDAAHFLGAPLVILRSEKTVLETMLAEGKWPHFLHPYCHECLHQPLDNYMKQFRPAEIAILRGGRLSERAATGKKNSSRFLTVDRMAGYVYFQPLYFADKETSVRLLEEAGMPLWEGYARGLQRTACRICPGQRPRAYTALRAQYPDVWVELLDLERRFGPGAWQGRGDGPAPSFAELAAKGAVEA